MPPCLSQLAFLPSFFKNFVAFEKNEKNINYLVWKKKRKKKTFSKTTINVDNTHFGIWKEVAKQLQGRKKTCTKNFHSARREQYQKLDTMTTNVNDTHFGVWRDGTKNCKEEEKTLYQTIMNYKKKCTWSIN